jgi:outer membrane protein TolC
LSQGARVQASGALRRNETDSSFATLNPSYDASADLSIAQPILKGSGFVVNRAEISRGEIALRRAGASVRAAVLDVLLETEASYWGIRVAQERETIHQASLAAAETLRDETIEKEKEGLQTRIDVLQAEAGVAQRLETLILDKQQIADLTDDLRLLLGQTEAFEGPPAVADLPPLEGADPDPVASMERALVAQPEYLIQVEALAERELSSEIAQKENRPSLDLNLRGGYDGRADSESGAWEGVWNGDGYSWQVDLAFAMPWALRDTRARLIQARAQLEQASWDLHRIELEMEKEIRAACRAVVAGRERVRVTQLSREVSERQLAQEKSRFDVGLATVRQVLDVQEDLEIARLRELEAVRDTLIAILRLGRLEGSLMQRHGLSWREVEGEDLEPKDDT